MRGKILRLIKLEKFATQEHIYFRQVQGNQHWKEPFKILIYTDGFRISCCFLGK